MKILVITDLYPIKNNEKYTPKTIFNFVQGWKNLGHEVFIIKPNFIANSFLRKKPFYSTNVYGEVININYWTPFLGNIKEKAEKRFNLSHIFSSDFVIAHMPSGILFANKLGVPFIPGVHSSDIEILTNPLYSFYFKTELEKAYKNAKKIACRSKIIEEKFLNLYSEYEQKTFIAYSGITPEIITQGRWIDKKSYKILTCANLIKRKHIDKVISACEKINNAELTVIGDGVELTKLKKMSQKTKFLGYLNHKDVIQEMKNSDIFILPSERETFGMVYLEAMAAGCVTVGLKNDGIDGIIQDGVNGYLTDLNNIETTLKTILNANNAEILKNSYKTIQNYTNERACVNYIEQIIK